MFFPLRLNEDGYMDTNIDKTSPKFNRLIFGDDNVLVLSNQHMQVHADVYPLLEEAFSMFIPTKETIQKISVKFDRIIGFTICVKTTPEDEIVYAKRKGRKWKSRMVKNRTPTPSNELTFVVKRCKNKIYRLLTAYIGSQSEREPNDTNIRTDEEYERCVEFWSNHALLYIEEDISVN